MLELIEKLWIPGLISIAAGYLLGSVSFSIILARLYGKGDIREYGSGNAGMTNVMRVIGKKEGIITFALDFVKCVVAVLIGYLVFRFACESEGLSLDYVFFGKYIGGLGCLIGHLFPLYFGFRGGKGVVTCCALILLLDWRVFIPALAVFIIVYKLRKIVSLGWIWAFICYPILTFAVTFLFDCALSPLSFAGEKTLGYVIAVTVCSLIMSVFILCVHIPNIKRLLKGEEKPLVAYKGN